jgi:hypothetical protein
VASQFSDRDVAACVTLVRATCADRDHGHGQQEHTETESHSTDAPCDGNERRAERDAG